jgi:CheY-like chemotaxis protein
MLKYKRIVLVDDDMDDRQMFGEILSEIAPEAVVECAENGLDMVALLNAKSDDQLPEMIILDQNMPQMTGKESLIFLKTSPRYRDIPVIVYSTYQIRDFYQECLRLGAHDVVPKPDTIQAYRTLIQQLVAIPPAQPPSTGSAGATSSSAAPTVSAPSETLTASAPPEMLTASAPPETLTPSASPETLTPSAPSETLIPSALSETLAPSASSESIGSPAVPDSFTQPPSIA